MLNRIVPKRHNIARSRGFSGVTQANRHLKKENAKRTPHLKEIRRKDWPDSLARHPDPPDRVFISQTHMAQVFEGSPIRISITRTVLGPDGAWADKITYDDLMVIKNQIGYADRDFVELLPAERDEVNVANVRHIWSLDVEPDWKWKSENK